MFTCRNFYPYFGMCMNNKKKCEEISNGRDDIIISDIVKIVEQIFYEKKN